MVNTKKFYKYDMRDDFSIPVYVGYDLIDISGIKGIDVNNRVAGQLIREKRQTYLELADNPTIKGYVSSNPSGMLIDNEDEINNQDDGGYLYACTWDGELQFIFHKYIRMGSSINMANNHFSGETSKWLISDYSIASQLMLPEYVTHASLSLDHVYTWFNIFRPEFDLSKLDSLSFKDLIFENQSFSLIVCANGQNKHDYHVFKKTAYMTIDLEFKNHQPREFVYSLAVATRNLFQMLTGKSVGISRIILNKDNSFGPSYIKLVPKDERENWFLDQSFLPNSVKETTTNFAISYSDIKKDFKSILVQYFLDSKLQRFVNSFLIVDQFQVPVDTQIITIVSAVETYYNEAKYSNGKKIKNAINKLKKMGELIENPNNFFSGSVHGDAVDINSLFDEMVNARDYIVHGDKADKYSSEAELVPDLIIFKRIIRDIIVRIISMKVKANNK